MTLNDPDLAALPSLREDLRLVPGPARLDGSKCWLIMDPITNRFYEIGVEVHAALSAWRQCQNVGALRRQLQAETGAPVSHDEIAGLFHFLEEHSLLLEASGGWRAYASRAAKAKPGLLSWLIHNYLYIQIPIVRPHALLQAALPFVRWAFTPGFYVATVLVMLAGLYLASRQWDEFLASFAPLMSIEGATLFAVAITGVKILHELGHAFTAARFGCRVSSMGVAVVVMLPMLYTDVSDAWRLPRRQRMLIDAAGIIVELTLAAFATLAWVFLPDGVLKSIAFIIATTSWITSIAVNLNPLMRFDGYFLLADWTGVSNLQSRSNALGRWRLRELLFGLGEQPPEQLPKRTRRWLIAYAWIIWVYRLVVFTGIALMVYHYFFKILGLILFAVEIGYFIIAPIKREIQHWWKTRGRIARTGRSAVTLAAAMTIVAALIVPWSKHISVPAVRDNAVYARLFPARSAMIKAVHASHGKQVNKGDVLLDLEDPKLGQELRIAELRLDLLRQRLARRVADRLDRADSMSIEKEISMVEEQKAGLERELSELSVRAPISGRIVEFNAELKKGRWISRNEELALIVAPEHGVVFTGYVSNDDLVRIKAGSIGRFIPEDPLAVSEDVVVSDVAYSGSATIDIPYLASTLGGPVAVLEDKQRGAVPAEAAYLVTLRLRSERGYVNRVMRGVVSLEGTAESIVGRFWNRALNVLVRESGI